MTIAERKAKEAYDRTHMFFRGNNAVNCEKFRTYALPCSGAKLYSVPESFLWRGEASMDSNNHFRKFPQRPTDEFLAAWRDHIQNTGYPELFGRVSSSRPEQKHNIVLLSEEIRVPTQKRHDGERVPCPFCSPGAPKFGKGRMAWFPEEAVIRFVGHRCAQTHFGENYNEAELMFRRQETARRYIRIWKAVADVRDDLNALIARLEEIAASVEAVRREIDAKAPKLSHELHRELAQAKGDLQVTEDLGMRDRHGNVVVQTKVIGTSAGLLFLRDTFHPLKYIKRAKAALAMTEIDLPTWAPSTPEHPSTDDILNAGRSLIKALSALPDARDTVEDAVKFLQRPNIRLLQEWGKASSSPFATFDMKMQGRQIIIRASSFADRFYANAEVPDIQPKDVPAAVDPALQWVKEIEA